MRIRQTHQVQAAEWRACFVVDGERGGPIRLEQVDDRNFDLLSTIHYDGPTGLEARVSADIIEDIRHLVPGQLSGTAATDLASIPGPMRWFVGPYGPHTAAALFHDRLLRPGRPSSITDPYADRYFRFLLAASGVHFLKRWLMWSAVAMRSRFEAGGLRAVSAATWLVLAVTGTVTLGIGAVSGNGGLVTIALLAPVPAAALWVRQFGAGVVAAYSFPWLLPPVVLAAAAYTIYRSLESTLDAGFGVARWGKTSVNRLRRSAPSGTPGSGLRI